MSLLRNVILPRLKLATVVLACILPIQAQAYKAGIGGDTWVLKYGEESALGDKNAVEVWEATSDEVDGIQTFKSSLKQGGEYHGFVIVTRQDENHYFAVSKMAVVGNEKVSFTCSYAGAFNEEYHTIDGRSACDNGGGASYTGVMSHR